MLKTIFPTVFTLLISFNLLFARGFTPDHLNDSKLLNAIQIKEKIKIDGILNEYVWQQAVFSNSFQQTEPGDGDPPTEPTEIGCLYDKNNLYFGIRCYDSEPHKIIRTELRRDEFMDYDDYVEIILDTYHDERSGFYFIFNAYGNKRDAKMADEGRSYNPDWDGIWECKTHITEKGWFVELAIPWKTLRFEEKEDVYFGINIGRMIRRKNENLDWSHVSRDIGGFGLFKLSEAGHVGPFKNIKMGGNLEFRPYAIGGVQKDIQTNFDLKKLDDFGIDAKVNITSNLAADLTINTDFAQVEADQEQVNLTRFSLYFPEKREFFLEGAEIFGTSSGRGASSNEPVFFYSRRIGIQHGNKIPLYGGVKVTGKLGKTTLGILNMQTRQKDILFNDESINVASTNYSVFRIKQDVFSRSSIGFILTNNVEESNSRNNQTYALDTHLSISPTVTMTTLLGGSHTSDRSNADSKVMNLNLSWRTDRYNSSVTFLDVDRNFNAEMGFVRRNDIRHSSANFYFTPRSERIKAVRKYSYGIKTNYLTDHDNRLFNRDVSLNYSINFQSAAQFNLSAGREYEFLTQNWEVRPAIMIMRDIYNSTFLSTSFSSNPSRPFAFDIKYSLSDYYSGTINSFSGGINFNKIPKLKIDAEYQYNDVKLPETNFHTFTISNRIVYAFSTSLYIKAYIQYNSDRLRYDGRNKWNANLLFRYIYKPGSDIYFVYNQEQLLGNNQDELRNRTFLAKIIYFWRK